jgi:hypothetical protein
MKTRHDAPKPDQPAPENAGKPADHGREPMPRPSDTPKVAPPPTRDQRRNRSI